MAGLLKIFTQTLKALILQYQPARGVPRKRCSENYATNLQEKTHEATLLKSHFGMGVLL